MGASVRICKIKHASTAFDGMGASAFPGRWNSSGHRMVYTSECSALAFLEILVHATDALMPHYVLFNLGFDDGLVESLNDAALPPNWATLSEPGWAPLQAIGTEWLLSLRTPIFRVPTAVVPDQSNFLLNPMHPRFKDIHIHPLRTISPDPRLR